MTKLAIAIATFYRKDGSTSQYLTRALSSIKAQTYDNYHVYLIGDLYEKEDELRQLAKIIDESKITVVNLPVAKERSKYSGKQLWVCGGVNAYNAAIDLAQKDGLDYVCHLDHDDYWSNNHLAEINKALETYKVNFVCTLAETATNKALPEVKSTDYHVKFLPEASKIIHSSTCVNFFYFGMKYRNMIEECNQVYPSDADLWSRINKFYKQKNEHGILVNVKTTFKDSGMSVIKTPQIV